MIELPFELIFNILNYNYNINILLNKEYCEILQRECDKFKNDPLIVNYRLLKCRRKINDLPNVAPYRRTPSIKATDTKTILLNGIIPLGNIINDKIIPSIELKKKIIPAETKFIYPHYMWSFYPEAYILIYWEIFDIEILDIKKAWLYSKLFNNYQTEEGTCEPFWNC